MNGCQVLSLAWLVWATSMSASAFAAKRMSVELQEARLSGTEMWRGTIRNGNACRAQCMSNRRCAGWTTVPAQPPTQPTCIMYGFQGTLTVAPNSKSVRMGPTIKHRVMHMTSGLVVDRPVGWRASSKLTPSMLPQVRFDSGMYTRMSLYVDKGRAVRDTSRTVWDPLERLALTRNVPRLDDCRLLCMAEADCHAITHHARSKTCYTYRHAATTRAYGGRRYVTEVRRRDKPPGPPPRIDPPRSASIMMKYTATGFDAKRDWSNECTVRDRFYREIGRVRFEHRAHYANRKKWGVTNPQVCVTGQLPFLVTCPTKGAYNPGARDARHIIRAADIRNGRPQFDIISSFRSVLVKYDFRLR